jgi:hypothetical protein
MQFMGKAFKFHPSMSAKAISLSEAVRVEQAQLRSLLSLSLSVNLKVDLKARCPYHL